MAIYIGETKVSGAGTGRVIQDDGTDVEDRDNLNIKSPLSVTDNSTDNSTEIGLGTFEASDHLNSAEDGSNASDGQVLTADGSGGVSWEDAITNEEIEDVVGGMLNGTETRISASYNDTDGNIDFVVDGDLTNYSSNDNGTNATDGHVLTADGSGGVAWEAPSGGGGGVGLSTGTWSPTGNTGLGFTNSVYSRIGNVVVCYAEVSEGTADSQDDFFINFSSFPFAPNTGEFIGALGHHSGTHATSYGVWESTQVFFRAKSVTGTGSEFTPVGDLSSRSLVRLEYTTNAS